MSDKQVLLKEELEVLQEQHQKFLKITNDLGTIEIMVSDFKNQIVSAEKNKETLLQMLSELRAKGEETQKSLLEKYGNIDIDLTTGEFVKLP